MIAVDTNLLVYAHREDSPWHETAYRCIKQLAEAPAPWAIPWPCMHEFLSVVTHPRIYSPPTHIREALDQVAAWQEAPALVLLSESNGYWEHLQALLRSGQLWVPKSMMHALQRFVCITTLKNSGQPAVILADLPACPCVLL